MKYEQWTRAVLQVGGGRGFVVKLDSHRRAVVTAAHCLPAFPRPHPALSSIEATFQLLGPLQGEPSVWTTCLFIDLMADLAVLGRPAGLGREKAYDALVGSTGTMVIADAPAEIPVPTPGMGPAWVLSLSGRRWNIGQVRRTGSWLAFEPENLIRSGMSGSPIISATTGGAIGVVSVDHRNPVLVDSLSARLLREITASQ
jgi:hypothetical protein